MHPHKGFDLESRREEALVVAREMRASKSVKPREHDDVFKYLPNGADEKTFEVRHVVHASSASTQQSPGAASEGTP